VEAAVQVAERGVLAPLRDHRFLSEPTSSWTSPGEITLLARVNTGSRKPGVVLLASQIQPAGGHAGASRDDVNDLALRWLSGHDRELLFSDSRQVPTRSSIKQILLLARWPDKRQGRASYSPVGAQ